MNQEEIFKLLLTVLLLSNEKDNCPVAATPSKYSSLNEIIILSLLLFSGKDTAAVAAAAAVAAESSF